MIQREEGNMIENNCRFRKSGLLIDRAISPGWRWLPFAAGLLVLTLAAQAEEKQSPMTRKKGQELAFVLTAAVRTSQVPNVDGKLNEACWREAPVAGDFLILRRTDYAPEQTEAMVVWDDAHLYIGVRCFESNGDILSEFEKNMAKRDGAPVGLDRIETFPGNSVDQPQVFLIPPENSILAAVFPAERYFQFSANALGEKYDAVGLNPVRWNGTWTAEASVHKDRWEIELAIPWTTLKTKPVDGDIWSINFNRAGSGWSPTGGTFHAPDHFGRIIFLDHWPHVGSQAIGPDIAARVVRNIELDPVLDRTSALLKDAGAELSAVSARTELPAITRTMTAVDDAATEAGEVRDALIALAPDEIVATWESLRDRYGRIQQKAERLAARSALYAGLNAAQRSGDDPIPDFYTFMLPAITNERVLPRRLPANTLPGHAMKLTSCPGEYESGSFGLYALADLEGVLLTPTDLKGPNGTVDASALDLRVVKVWYQSGRNIWFTNSRLLTPELLLKDDRLVRIDEARKINILNMDKDAVRDADVLQPFDVPTGTVKQCWVTVHVPTGTPAGTYHGTIRITPAGGTSVAVPVQLRVLPFELDEPKLICSMYYHAHLGASTPKVTSGSKTEEQLLAEFKDMRAHGLTHPMCKQGPKRGEDGTYDFTMLERYLDLRKQAGLEGGPLLMMSPGADAEPQLLRATVTLAKGHGFSEVYFMGTDERKGSQLRAERPSLQKVHRAGGKVFVACFGDAYQIIGDLLDLPIVFGLDPAMGEAFHAAGQLIGSYANPQGGVEEPQTYRLNYGLRLWKAGYDCACTYAYQHVSGGDAYDDYDDELLRDILMAYPTVNGVIPTLQWEGYREGYDDLRYLATLQNLIDKTRYQEGLVGESARAAEVWVSRIDPGSGAAAPPARLDDIRTGIIQRILAIREAKPQ